MGSRYRCRVSPSGVPGCVPGSATGGTSGIGGGGDFFFLALEDDLALPINAAFEAIPELDLPVEIEAGDAVQLDVNLAFSPVSALPGTALFGITVDGTLLPETIRGAGFLAGDIATPQPISLQGLLALDAGAHTIGVSRLTLGNAIQIRPSLVLTGGEGASVRVSALPAQN